MNTEQIRKLLEAKKLIIGHRATLRALKDGKLITVLLATNAPEMEADAIRGYADMSKVESKTLEARNDQLGTICRRPFPISFLGVLK